MRIFSRLFFVTILTAGVCGCQSDVSTRAILKHPTPELKAIKDRPVDASVNYAYMRNTNLRAFWDDVARSWYIDHPSRLSPYPIVYTSGNPR